jgi:hypothetical protein
MKQGNVWGARKNKIGLSIAEREFVITRVFKTINYFLLSAVSSFNIYYIGNRHGQQLYVVYTYTVNETNNFPNISMVSLRCIQYNRAFQCNPLFL